MIRDRLDPANPWKAAKPADWRRKQKKRRRVADASRRRNRH